MSAWARSGPFNVSCKSSMINIANQCCGLLDLMSIRQSSTPPATYGRGRNRLDYALPTAHVGNALSQAGFEAFHAKFPSEHRAYCLDFDTTKRFGTETQHLGKPTDRILPSNNVAQIAQYIKAKYNLLIQHNAFERGDWLSHPGNRHSFTVEEMNWYNYWHLLSSCCPHEACLVLLMKAEWILILEKTRRYWLLEEVDWNCHPCMLASIGLTR